MSRGFGREYPKGRINAEDDGQCNIAIASDLQARRVMVRFEKPILWLGLDAEAGINLLVHLAKHLSNITGKTISVKFTDEDA